MSLREISSDIVSAVVTLIRKLVKTDKFNIIVKFIGNPSMRLYWFPPDSKISFVIDRKPSNNPIVTIHVGGYERKLEFGMANLESEINCNIPNPKMYLTDSEMKTCNEMARDILKSMIKHLEEKIEYESNLVKAFEEQLLPINGIARTEHEIRVYKGCIKNRNEDISRHNGKLHALNCRLQRI